ncbi:MAG: hypothetical protein QOF48_664, partial [Verrucomicrobiota bacterium]
MSDTPAPPVVPASRRPVKHIVISGTNFWNPGDDFVRDGVIRILRNVFPGTALNFLFYNFNADFFPQDKFAGIGNFVSRGDLDRYRDSIDAVVIAGLSAGDEIKDLYRWILSNGLEERVWLIGAGYENNYVAEHIGQEPEASIFKKARLVIGRTAKTPGFLSSLGTPYQHLNCPAILSVPDVKSIPPRRKIERIGFSIQLPHDEGLLNHSCARQQYELAVSLLQELSQRFAVEVIAHHKTEYYHFLELLKGRDIPVLFSSFYQDLSGFYRELDLVVTTRLHASLFANGHGIPGIIINDTDRHTHTLDGFPHSTWVNTREAFDREFQRLCQADLQKISAESKAFKECLLQKYVAALSPLRNSSAQELAGAPAHKVSYQFDSELKEQALVRQLVAPGMTAFDVGANIGKYTKLFSLLVGDTGKVFAFEPAPVSFQRITSLAAAENLTNVTPVHRAVCEREGRITLHQFPEEYSSWNSLGRPEMEDPRDPSRLVPIVGTVDVEATTLDGFCRQHGIEQIDYLKLDVEGAELRALEGARQLLQRKAVRYLQFEISQKMLEGLNTRARPVFDFLAQAGYECRAITSEGRIGGQVTDSSAFYENYIAIPAAPLAPARDLADPLPIHFFTIVLNGQPFIRHHIDVLRQLPFRWHWHIVEGVADLTHDTAWSKALGGRITPQIHRDGLSNDGTTEYLDELARKFPGQVTVHRKAPGTFWDGKLEMVNAPLLEIREDCLLWQLDSDELWTAEQLTFARRLFLGRPDKTAAFYHCHYFVGENLVISTRDTYGNHTDYEWIRTWRYKPGCRWVAHEPPRLCQPDARGQLADLATLNPFRHKETEALDLVFQHFAYVTEAQLRFKETYYGYSGALAQWRGLQAQKKFPVQLSDHFSWVKDKAQVNTVRAEGIVPLARANASGEWSFDCSQSPPTLSEPAPLLPFSQNAADAGTIQSLASQDRRAVSRTEVQPPPVSSNGAPDRVLFVRTDSIGDAVLAASMLPHLRAKFPGAQIGVLCQETLGELYLACPFVDVVISFDKRRASEDQAYRDSIVAEIGGFRPRIILNSTYSSEALTEFLIHSHRGPEFIGMDGDLSNIGSDDYEAARSLYTRLISSTGSQKTELEHHRDFLAGLDIQVETLEPQIWITPQQEARAAMWFEEHQLEPARTIALFPAAQHDCKIYPHFAAALREFSDFKFLIFGGAECVPLADSLSAQLPGACVNLCGKTSLLEMAALMSKCRLYVGADSAGAHIACAVGLQNVVVLGGGHFGRFLPYSQLTSVAALPLECFHCNWACSFERAHCVKDLAPEVVTHAIRATMAESTTKPRLFYQDEPGWKSVPGLPRWAPVDSVISTKRVEHVRVPVGPSISLPAPATSSPGDILISVLVSTYNSERYLRACLQDLEDQTIAHRMEIIVIDSGSEQNERGIVEDFQRRHGNIVYLRTERETLYAAWNRGVRMARGQFITNANSDDSHRPDALEILAAALQENPEAGLAYGDYFTSTVPNDSFANPQVLRRIVHPPYHPATLLFYCVTGCHPMWRRTVFDKIGLFDATYTAPGDYEFLLRFVKSGLRAIRVPQELSLFYQNPDGLSFKAQSKSEQEFKRIQAKYRAEMPIERLFKVQKGNPASVASAWVALGNMAIRYQAPWFDNVSQDLDYATTCYNRALKSDPRHPAALHNLAIARLLRGEMREAESVLQQLPPEQAGTLKANLRCGHLEWIHVDAAPAVEPLEFRSTAPDSTAVACSPASSVQPSQSGTGLASRQDHFPVRWIAPFFAPGQYARDAVNLVVPLTRKLHVGALDQSEPCSENIATRHDPVTRGVLQSALEEFPFIIGGVVISHRPGAQFNRLKGAVYHIGRTLFETDTLPQDWVKVCNQMDELWVASPFNLEAFAEAGVERDKLFVIPPAVDTERLDAGKTEPFALPNRAAFNFLSVFEWSPLAGWDVLLEA